MLYWQQWIGWRAFVSFVISGPLSMRSIEFDVNGAIRQQFSLCHCSQTLSTNKCSLKKCISNLLFSLYIIAIILYLFYYICLRYVSQLSHHLTVHLVFILLSLKSMANIPQKSIRKDLFPKNSQKMSRISSNNRKEIIAVKLIENGLSEVWALQLVSQICTALNVLSAVDSPNGLLSLYQIPFMFEREI